MSRIMETTEVRADSEEDAMRSQSTLSLGFSSFCCFS